MSSSITWGGGSVAELWSQILPDWTKPLELSKAGTYELKNDCWIYCHPEAHSTVAYNYVNDHIMATAHHPAAYYFRYDQFLPGTNGDKVQLTQYYAYVTLYPCKYITEQLEASPVIISNELGEEQSLLERLLIKEYRPFTEEEFKQMEKENNQRL